ncbi:hypothetical protein DSO57_1001462 [Entomophthora muscae]|uniref:Uncharacterized protein n=1 Tax=Entomophthora muscae TaxID=34485 RepID=A0ACC2UJ60_9FUNG|nr:hypothetical protein DSO57_1001462 [Entomophthora muscae]
MRIYEQVMKLVLLCTLGATLAEMDKCAYCYEELNCIASCNFVPNPAPKVVKEIETCKPKCRDDANCFSSCAGKLLTADQPAKNETTKSTNQGQGSTTTSYAPPSYTYSPIFLSLLLPILPLDL